MSSPGSAVSQCGHRWHLGLMYFYLFPLTYHPLIFLWPLHSFLIWYWLRHNCFARLMVMRVGGHHDSTPFSQRRVFKLSLDSLCVSYSELSLEWVCFQRVAVASQVLTSAVLEQFYRQLVGALKRGKIR
jgi:hypothetical protein